MICRMRKLWRGQTSLFAGQGSVNVLQVRSLGEIPPAGESLDLPPAPLLLRPALAETGPLGLAPAVPAALAAEVLRWLGRSVEEATLVYSGNQVDARSLERLGYLPSWKALDLAAAPRWAVEPARLAVPLPAAAFSAHTLVLVAALGTHPTERMVGCLDTLLGLLPEAGRPDLHPARPELAALLLRLWPPDLCILDARQVHRWDEIDRFDRVAGGPILVGSDPLAVDTAAARLLGLRPQEVPLLAGTRRALRRPWPQVGSIEPLGPPPPPSRHFREARLLNSAGRMAYRLKATAHRLIWRTDLPRLSGFVRRVQEGL